MIFCANPIFRCTAPRLSCKFANDSHPADGLWKKRVRSQGALTASLSFCVALQLLRQVWRQVRDDERVVAFIFQLEDVADAVDFR